MAVTLLGLGSNLGQRRAYLKKAIAGIEKSVGHVLACSSHVTSAPWGYEGSHIYLNAAVAVETMLSPWQLLVATQEIEHSLGRRHKTEGGIYRDRIIDIDILFYDDLVVDTYELTIPHRHIADRWFVLEPLMEIAPQWVHPVFGQTIAQLAERYKQKTTGEIGGGKSDRL